MNAAKALVGSAIAGIGAITVPTATHPWSWWNLLAAAGVILVAFQAIYWTPSGAAAATTPTVKS